MIRPIGSIGRARPGPGLPETAPGFGEGLEELLRPAAPPAAPPPIEFAPSAQGRLNADGVALNPDDVEDIQWAMDSLARRGARESLVLVGDNAFIVGVPSRTVVTAMTRSEAVSSFFPYVDSAMVVH